MEENMYFSWAAIMVDQAVHRQCRILMQHGVNMDVIDAIITHAL